MKSILLISADLSERVGLEEGLVAEGWGVILVDDRQEALRAAADRAPDLVLVDSRVAGAGNLVQTFGASNGGPGAVVLAEVDEPAAEPLGELADGLLTRPIEGSELSAAIHRILESPRASGPSVTAAPEKRLTAAEIFSDVLKSVESGSTSLVDRARPATAAVMDEVIADAAALFETTRIPPIKPPPEAEATGEVPTVEPRETEERRFGQYRLLDRVAVGGMAEVWKADMEGLEGFRKTVAIKKILPHLTESADFVTMFIDEAKLAAQLSHENILDIYELGRIEDDYFIAMEYVDGRDLRSLLNAVGARQTKLPLGLALLIGSRVARALEHAHWRRDPDGQLLGLVHRDVSPRNVLVSYDGTVKLCDFGVAKAATQVAETQIGTLKGKLQYMSPEQARGEGVDARSDIFSLGALMFEMTTGEPLFAAESEGALLEAVRACKVRDPAKVDSSLPPEVSRIIARALHGSPARRYQSAGELLEELDTFLRALRPPPTDEDLAAYLEEFFPDDAPGKSPAAQTKVAPPSPFEPPPMPPPGVGTEVGRVESAERPPWAGIVAVAAAGSLLLAALVYLLARLLSG